MVEEKKSYHQSVSQNVILENRKSMSVSGVKDVDSFDENAVALFTELGNMLISGSDLHISRLNIENGEVIIDPSVKNYFIEGYDDDVAKEVQHDLGNTTRAYYDVRRFIDKTDVKIYNASRKTKLEAFERVTFEEALEQIEARQRETD